MDKTWKKEAGFFKFFVHERSAQRLKIPAAYTCYKKRNLPATVFLRDRYGNLWIADIEEIQTELFFVGGWSKFVQENSLETGDFLVFEFDGHNVFEVKILGSSCCEKVGVGGPRTQVKKEKQEYLETGEEEGEEEEEEGEGGEEEEEDEDEEKENSVSTEKDADEDFMDQEDDDYRSDTDDYNYEEEEHSDTCKRFIAIPQSRGCARKGLEKIQGKLYCGREESSSVKDKGGYKRPAADTYATEILESGCISPPKNPYFVTKIRPKRRDELYVPVDVIKDYNLDLPSKIILRDSDGREWATTRTPWKDGRIWYYGGWASLCRVNRVQETDTCICEFVKGKDKGKFHIQVRIVRSK